MVCLFAFISKTNNVLYERLHFRPQTPPTDPSNLCYSESIENELDSEGNVIPVVPITSFKDYIDENNLNLLSASNGNQNEIDFESFHRHQEELFEMQRKQLERLKHNCETNTDSSPMSNRSGYNVCNCEHSSNAMPLTLTTASLSSSKPSAKRQSSVDSSLPFSTLDSASAHFAVSVVRSASELTHNRTHNTNDTYKEVPQNCYTINSDNKCEKLIGSVGTIGATNGPTHEKDLLRKTINNEICLPSTTSLSSLSIKSNAEHDLKEKIESHNSPHNTPHNSHSQLSPLTLLTTLPSTPTPCKLKYQNRSQKTNTSIPPTDVT